MEKRHRMTHRRQISYLGFLLRLLDTFRLWLKSHKSNRKLRDWSLLVLCFCEVRTEAEEKVKDLNTTIDHNR